MANAANGIQNPVKPVYIAIKYLNPKNKIVKQPSWYKKALTCNFVMATFKMLKLKFIMIIMYQDFAEILFFYYLHTFRI